MKNQISEWKQQLKNELKKLRKLGPAMRGSIVLLKVNCGNKKCNCYKKKNAKHPAYYFSVNMNKKTKLIYLGKRRLNLAREYNNNYYRLWDILNNMTEIAMKIVKMS